MKDESPTHLLSSLGVLAQFSIAKKINEEEVNKETRKIKKVFKNLDKEKIQKLLSDVLVEKTKKEMEKKLPPGLILPNSLSNNPNLDKFYKELAIISQTLANKFCEQNLTKHQVCFIITAIIELLNLTIDDFSDFNQKFNKYKENRMDDEDSDEDFDNFFGEED